MKIGFYYNCYKNNHATENILKRLRQFYPDNPVYLLSDKGDDFNEIAKKYNCYYKYSEINILGGRKFNGKHFMCFGGFEHCQTYIKELKNAIEYCQTEYLIFIEDDVYINGKINNFPKVAGGNLAKNNFNLLINLNKIKEKYKTIKFDYWSMAGGSIIKTNVLKNILNISEEELRFFDKDCKHQCHELWHTNDVLISYLLMINGYQVDDWTNTKKSNIMHPYKKFY